MICAAQSKTACLRGADRIHALCAVVGHMKTVLILTGGCLLFGEEMPLPRFVGVCLALAGIFWYSALKFQASCLQPCKGLLVSASLFRAYDTISLGQSVCPKLQQLCMAVQPHVHS